MAANDELPRGWVYTAHAAAPTITVPALAGITHVLDSAELMLNDGTAITGLLAVSSSLNTINGAAASLPIAYYMTQSGNAFADVSEDGLGLAAMPDESITVFAGTSGFDAVLIIKGHDI